MTDRSKRSEHANAEILGVVILIGIFAITAGIISALTFASPQPVKIPVASIEITNSSATMLRFAHNGGDPLPLTSLFIMGMQADGSPERMLAADWLEITGGSAIENGFVKDGIANSYAAIALTWEPPDSSASVIASWDPSGLLPLGGGAVPGGIFPPRTQPPVPNATTDWNATLQGVVADFTPDDGFTIAAGSTFYFDDNSTGSITHWSWNFGDGTTHEGAASGGPFPFSYGREGTYSVTLTVSNAETGALDIARHTIIVEGPSVEAPLVDFSIDSYFYSERDDRDFGNRELTVTCLARASVNATAWQWETFDSQNGTTTRIGPFYGDLMADPSKSQVFEFSNHDPLINNLCTVTLTVWSPYIADPIVVTKTVTVGGPLKASFITNVTDGIRSLPVLFADTSTGIADTRLWDFGDGNTSTDQNPEHIYTVAGIYTVSLTLTGYDQTLPGIPPGSHMVTDRATATIVVEDPVIANFTANVTIGELGYGGFPVAFTDLSTGDPTNWTWSFGDGTTSHEQHPVHTYTSNGKWMVSLVAEKFDPDSADVMVKYIYIRVGPAVAADFIAAPTVVAAGSPVQFTDRSTSADPSFPVNSWNWDFGDGGTSTAPNPSHVYTTPGTYSVTLTVENDFRVNTTIKVGYIDVKPAVEASFIADRTEGSAPMAVQFTDTSTGDPTAWAWDFGDGTNSTDQDPAHIYTASGLFNITLTASTPYSSNTTSRVGYIQVYVPPVANFTATSAGGVSPIWMDCADISSGRPTNWSWDFGDGRTSSQQNVTHGYDLPGNYTVTLTVRNPAGEDTESRTITAAVETRTITATAGTGGTISPAGAVPVQKGGSQVFDITPNTGYHVVNVLVNGVSQGAIPQYTFTDVTMDQTISASFAINTYTITPSWEYSHEQDSISPNTVQTVTHGGSTSFKMTAKFRILEVRVDGAVVKTNPSSPYWYYFTDVTANHTIHVKFGK